MSSLRLAASAALLLASGAARAQSPWIQAGIEHPECTCRAHGANLALGSKICLATAEGMRMAECVMEQNVTSWRAGVEPCPPELFSRRLSGARLDLARR